MASRDVFMLSFLLERLRQRLQRETSAPSSDLVSDILGEEDLQHYSVRRPDGSTADVCALSDLTDIKGLQDLVLTPLQGGADPVTIALPMASEVTTVQTARAALLAGDALIFESGSAFAHPMGAFPKRQVGPPTTERALLGSQDSFIEDLDTNIALVRRHLPDTALVVRRLSVGTLAPKNCAILWLTDAADPGIPGEIIERFSAEMLPRVMNVTELLPVLFGPSASPFLRAGFSERPMYNAGQLIRGRVVVLLDGSPMGMILPQSLDEALRDDESTFPSIAVRIFVRLTRVIALTTATLLPGLFLSVLTINTRVLPTLLAVEVSASRQQVPYPVITETFLLLIVLDVLAESTISMKGVLGPAISIVGSLIIGQAAVQAHLASNLSVILVAMTALGTFITPWFQNSYAYRIWKYPIFVLSGFLGLVGWTLGVVLLLAHLSGLRSFGTSYLTPLAPFRPETLSSSGSFGTGVIQRETSPLGSQGHRQS